ncbi:MAG: HAD-IA family hydrolase [Clostridia bacterium]|nr:HAD-IA family hydrolase [Clostridia bacterium]
MKRIEDIIGDKILDLAHLVLTKLVKADLQVENVREITPDMIKKLKEDYNIEGVIIDVDETLRKDMKDMPKCNKEWLESLKGELKVVILTNGIDKELGKYFKSQDIDYIDFAMKPLKRNFKKACNRMDVKPENVLVIGDDLFDDIHGGQKNKMKTILVKNVEEDEEER